MDGGCRLASAEILSASPGPARLRTEQVPGPLDPSSPLPKWAVRDCSSALSVLLHVPLYRYSPPCIDRSAAPPLVGRVSITRDDLARLPAPSAAAVDDGICWPCAARRDGRPGKPRRAPRRPLQPTLVVSRQLALTGHRTRDSRRRPRSEHKILFTHMPDRVLKRA